MDGGYVDAETAQEPTGANGVTRKCSACGKEGHRMRTHRDCEFYMPRNIAAPQDPTIDLVAVEAANSAARDAEELDLMDNVDFGDEEFFDCVGFDEDDDDEVQIVAAII